MEKVFAIEFVRQLIIQTIREQNFINDKLIGKEEEIALTSFYEHLQSKEAVDRYVETVRDLLEQQNRTGLIANGVIATSESPTITNINQSTIIPLSFNVNFRATLEDRDSVRETLFNAIKVLKGRKWDIAEFDNGELLKVGTLGNNAIGQPEINRGDLICEVSYGGIVDTVIKSRIASLVAMGFANYVGSGFTNTAYLYYIQLGQYGGASKLKVAIYNPYTETWNTVEENDGTHNDVIFPPLENTYGNFVRKQVSISFDSENCSEPRNLNAKDYVDLYFGGSATIADETVLLGNQLTKLYMKKIVIDKEDTLVTFSNSEPYYYLEPLEFNNKNSINSITSLVAHNAMVNKNHNNNMTGGIQYSFIVDSKISLLIQWYKFARYMKQGTIDGNEISDLSYMSLNIIYEVNELYSCWGNVEIETYYGKVVGDIDVDNTESDVMTVGISMQPQGDVPIIIQEIEE